MRTIRSIASISLFMILLLSGIHSQNKKDNLVTIGKASYYGGSFHGQETSSGDVFNRNDFTAAHRTLPFNTIVSVTNKNNGKNVLVRINDRGPYVKSRIIDLAKSAAMKIGMVPFGVVPVKIQVLDILDYVPLHDTLVNPEDIWDCFGNRRNFQSNTVYIWSTADIKHAFYMATGVSLDYRLDSVLVKVTGEITNRKYKLYATSISTKKGAHELVAALRKDGFMFSKVVADTGSSKAKQRDGQSAK